MNGSANAEDRYRSGELAFEDALREVTGTDIGRDDLVQILHSLASRKSVAPELSEHDARILEEAGLVSDPAAATAARLDRDIRMVELVRSSLSIDDAADRLGVTPARVRQRLTAGTLWAFDSGRNRLLPPAQFTDTGEVPHLDKLTPFIGKDLHPLTVQALLTRPQPSLTVDGQPVSIVAWLTGCAGTATDIAQAADVITAAEWESA
ncbi:hypothetical protein M2284_003718 [Rhodococcus sp. LBL1]|nr:hypothetical protein [Rhodococcus sp. LBL1]MDH6685365.1 hypothetical protein [Rhodococcus sp. LBL2]